MGAVLQKTACKAACVTTWMTRWRRHQMKTSFDALYTLKQQWDDALGTAGSGFGTLT